ncbi:MAG: hypothetical protein WA705_03800 [Candidatus Ozemobacteraceae bacterium]
MNASLRTPAKKILIFFANENIVDGFDLFWKTFSPENPPPEKLVLEIDASLQKQGAYQESFDFLSKIIPWMPKSEGMEKVFSESKLLLAGFVMHRGETLLVEAAIKGEELDKPPASGMLGIDKFREENVKSHQNLLNSAREKFERAFELDPENIRIIQGLQACRAAFHLDEEVKSLGDLILKVKRSRLPRVKLAADGNVEVSPDNADEPLAEETLQAPSPIVQEPEKPKTELPSLGVPPPPSPNFEQLNRLFQKGEFEKVQFDLETLIEAEEDNIPALLLLVQTHIKLHEFRSAERVLYKAKLADPRNKEIPIIRNDLLEIKLRALRRGATEFLKSGMTLGTYLGKFRFQKAELCLVQALEILPDDPGLLDQYHCTLMFLGKTPEAEKVKAKLRRLSSRYKPLWDHENSDSLCFFAGFAYVGDETILADFRKFRRDWLLPSPLGRRMVTAYTRLAPSIVTMAKKYSLPPTLFRLLLSPLRRLILAFQKHP